MPIAPWAHTIAARISPDRVVQIIERTFPGSVALEPRVAREAVSLLAAAGIAGGAVYDGLVALAARESGLPLLSCDRRAGSRMDRVGRGVSSIRPAAYAAVRLRFGTRADAAPG